MNPKIQDQVMNLLEITQEEERSLLRRFTKTPIESKNEIMKLNREIFYPLRQLNNEIELSLISYASLMLAIKKYFNTTDELDLNSIEIKSQKSRKQPKKEKLLTYWALIKSLKNDKKLSFREIEIYLKKYHKFSIKHSSIWELWQLKEVEKTFTEKGNK